MKITLIILATIWSSALFAVQTKFCPESFVVDVPEVEVFSKDFVQKKIDKLNFRNTGKSNYDADSVLFFQDGNSVDAFKIQFGLDVVRNSNCYYHNESLWNGSVRASITGTDKAPKLTLNFVDADAAFDWRQGPVELIMFADTVVKRPFYDFSGETLQIKATGVKSSRGQTYAVYIPVGKAKISGTSQKNYQLSDETWSIELLTETCSTKLREEIEFITIGFGDGQLVATLPKTIGYKYFNVDFRVLKNSVLSSEVLFTYQYEYSTVDDQHLICDRVQPVDYVD